MASKYQLDGVVDKVMLVSGGGLQLKLESGFIVNMPPIKGRVIRREDKIRLYGKKRANLKVFDAASFINVTNKSKGLMELNKLSLSIFDLCLIVTAYLAALFAVVSSFFTNWEYREELLIGSGIYSMFLILFSLNFIRNLTQTWPRTYQIRAVNGALKDWAKLPKEKDF